MNLDAFVRQRTPEWQELAWLVESAGRRPEQLGPGGVRRLGSTYRAAAADLALARRRWPGDPVTVRLEDLVGRSRHLVYATESRSRVAAPLPVPGLLAARPGTDRPGRAVLAPHARAGRAARRVGRLRPGGRRPVPPGPVPGGGEQRRGRPRSGRRPPGHPGRPDPDQQHPGVVRGLRRRHPGRGRHDPRPALQRRPDRRRGRADRGGRPARPVPVPGGAPRRAGAVGDRRQRRGGLHGGLGAHRPRAAEPAGRPGRRRPPGGGDRPGHHAVVRAGRARRGLRDARPASALGGAIAVGFWWRRRTGPWSSGGAAPNRLEPSAYSRLRALARR